MRQRSKRLIRRTSSPSSVCNQHSCSASAVYVASADRGASAINKRTARISWRLSVKVFQDHFPVRPPRSFSRRRNQIPPEVTAKHAVEKIKQAREHRKPCRLKVERTAPAVLVRHHVVVARGYRVSRRRNVQPEQRLRGRVPRFAPVEPWMRDQDLNASDEQRQKRHNSEPVRDANQHGVPGGGRRGSIDIEACGGGG